MTLPSMKFPAFFAAVVLAASCARRAVGQANGTLLFQNLRTLANSYSVNDRSTASTFRALEGPKGLASGDFDGDGRLDLATGNHDGTIAVLFGAVGGFEPVSFLRTGTTTAAVTGLRDVIAANVSGTGRPEIIAANPFEGKLYIFSLPGTGRDFGPPQVITTWLGARAVAAGDFNGDGLTDLAVGGAGTGGITEYRNTGSGFTALPALRDPETGPFYAGPASEASAKPVFTLHVWRRPGETRDRLAFTHAYAGQVWFLSGAAAGDPLSVDSRLHLRAGESVYDLLLGYFTPQSRVNGEPDLLTAATNKGEITLRTFVLGGTGYAGPTRRIPVPGGPRALTATDVNGDAWPDLLVVSLNRSNLTLYLNDQYGNFQMRSQTGTGSSPRDVVAGDFNRDGTPDAAVINRRSEDITVHTIDSSTHWFLQSPMINRVPGGLGSPHIVDLDADGKSELLFASNTGSQIYIQKMSASGWLPAVVYEMGSSPQSISTIDLNGDGRLDIITGTNSYSTGLRGLAYRLQLPDRSFGELRHVALSEVEPEPFRSMVASDFNGDGRADLILGGYYSGHLYFLEMTDGGLVFRRRENAGSFLSTIAAADMDQDGDADLVAADYYFNTRVIWNDGAWFSPTAQPEVTLLGAPAETPLWGLASISTRDRNGDGLPDLTLTGNVHEMTWLKGTGTTFSAGGVIPILPTFDAAGNDYDGDGEPDFFALCPTSTTASFFAGGQDPWFPYPVPETRDLATGDLDGDGKPDLAGTGDYLWVALSGSPAPPPVATPMPGSEVVTAAPVINEVLTSAESYLVPGQTRAADAVEIYNGTSSMVDFTGWKLRLLPEPGAPAAADFVFPSVAHLPGHRSVIICNEKTGAWEAPFKLPASGGTLVLLNGEGSPVDTVVYPQQQTDISYARLVDGAPSFVFSTFPGLGAMNLDNGNPDPKLSFKGLDPELLAGGLLRFRATAWDDQGLAGVYVVWQEVGGSSASAFRLYDDGLHGDGEAGDGTFGSEPVSPLPNGKVMEFYVSAYDFNWQGSTEPGGPVLSSGGQPITNYTFGLPAAPSGWEISEVLSRNAAALTDETGASPDWVEYRYAGTAAASTAGLYLADSLFNADERYALSRATTSAAPGSSFIAFLDGQPDSGSNPLHAPFKVSKDGDTLYLIRVQASGATELLDMARVPAMEVHDVSWARMGPGGPWVFTPSTPLAPNAPKGGGVFLLPQESGMNVMFAFKSDGIVEAGDTLSAFSPLLPRANRGPFESYYIEPLRNKRFFRIRP